MKRKTSNKRYPIIKRILDIFFSSLLIILLALPMGIIATVIIFESEGGAIFCQKRVGKGEKTFPCLKFRTMYKNAPSSVPKSRFCEVEGYITPFGRLLRRTSLDELPQLFNVFVGQMSIVGPRPLIPDEGEIHELRRQSGAYDLRPGLTGLAQARGRDSISDTEKARYDSEYARDISLLSDVRIIFDTARAAFSGN